jgi:hypothetical protein
MNTFININNEVLVKLTPYAHEIMREKHFKLYNGAAHAPEFKFPEADEDGYTKIQLWELMREFGDAMYNGNPRQCFVDNIIIVPHKD